MKRNSIYKALLLSTALVAMSGQANASATLEELNALFGPATTPQAFKTLATRCIDNGSLDGELAETAGIDDNGLKAQTGGPAGNTVAQDLDALNAAINPAIVPTNLTAAVASVHAALGGVQGANLTQAVDAVNVTLGGGGTTLARAQAAVAATNNPAADLLLGTVPPQTTAQAVQAVAALINGPIVPGNTLLADAQDLKAFTGVAGPTTVAEDLAAIKDDIAAVQPNLQIAVGNVQAALGGAGDLLVRTQTVRDVIDGTGLDLTAEANNLKVLTGLPAGTTVADDLNDIIDRIDPTAGVVDLNTAIDNVAARTGIVAADLLAQINAATARLFAVLDGHNITAGPLTADSTLAQLIARLETARQING